MCYAPFFVATSSLTGRGSKRASKKEGAGWAGTGGGGGGGSSFRSLPPTWCDPCVEDRCVDRFNESCPLFNEDVERREEVEKWSGRAWKYTRAGGPRRGGGGEAEHRRGCLIFSSKRWRTTFSLFSFFFFPSRSHRPGWATVERERRPRRVTLHIPAHNRPAADTRR